MVEKVLRVRDLRVNFYTYDGVVKALDGIDVDLRPNETHGLVGETGCGKSVTVNSLIKLIPIPPGKIEGGQALLYAPISCPDCGGKGCEVCRGTGTLEHCEECSGNGKCVKCRGFGRYRDGKTCRACSANGRCVSCDGSGSRYSDLLELTPKELREVRGGSVSMILQEPMSALNPVLSVAKQVGEAFYYHQRENLIGSTLVHLDQEIDRIERERQGIESSRLATERPLGVSLLGPIYVALSVLGIAISSLTAVLGDLLGFPALSWAAGGLVVLGLLYLSIGVGLWLLREWARRLAVILAVLGLLLSAVLLLILWPIALLGIAVGAPILWYLSRPHVRKSFEASQPIRLDLPILRLYRRIYRRWEREPDARSIEWLRKVPFLRRYHKRIEREVRARSLEALRMVRIPSPESVLDAYPHELSGGMMQRVVIAIALASRPRVLIADEPTTALDVTIQSQILRLMADLKAELGTAIIFITHDLAVIAQVCDRVSVMYAGTIAESAGVRDVFQKPLHPYTRGLMRAIPGPHEDVHRLSEIAGTVPNLITPPPGCRFHPRCPFAKEVCKREKPVLVEALESHRVACHMYNENATQWTDADRLISMEVLAP